MTGRARGWIVALGALLACAGCGYKGDLYLPEHNAAVVTRPAPPQAPATRRKSKTPPASQPASPPPASPPH